MYIKTDDLYNLYSLCIYVPIGAIIVVFVCMIPELTRFSNWQIKRRNLAI